MQRALFSLLAAAAALQAVTANGLKIDKTFEVECDRKTKSGDTIEVHYSGKLASNGQKFDASYDRGDPLSFQVGAGRVIKGWDEGLLDMCIGEKRTLTIPPEMGYGQRAQGPIPAGSTLIFETELMGIKGVPKPDKVVPKEPAAAKMKDKVADAVSTAAEVVKTMMADTDDAQEHNEL